MDYSPSPSYFPGSFGSTPPPLAGFVIPTASPWSRMLNDVTCTDTGFVSSSLPTPFPPPPCSQQKAIKVCISLSFYVSDHHSWKIWSLYSSIDMLIRHRTIQRLVERLLSKELPLRHHLAFKSRVHRHLTGVWPLSQTPRTFPSAFLHRSSSSHVIIALCAVTLGLLRFIEKIR
jgi:hypothetical protein